jgi:hypothetical protein
MGKIVWTQSWVNSGKPSTSLGNFSERNAGRVPEGHLHEKEQNIQLFYKFFS